MKISNQVRKYIELALREQLSKDCPNYGNKTIERIVKSSMDGLHVTKEVLYRAIALAAEK